MMALADGLVAQLVEQRTENPCVGGSIPSQATINPKNRYSSGSFFLRFFKSSIQFLH